MSWNTFLLFKPAPSGMSPRVVHGSTLLWGTDSSLGALWFDFPLKPAIGWSRAAVHPAASEHSSYYSWPPPSMSTGSTSVDSINHKFKIEENFQKVPKNKT